MPPPWISALHVLQQFRHSRHVVQKASGPRLRDASVSPCSRRLVGNLAGHKGLVPLLLLDRPCSYLTGAAWNKLLDAVDFHGGSNVVVVCHAATAAALVSHCLSLGPEGLPLMRCETTHSGSCRLFTSIKGRYSFFDELGSSVERYLESNKQLAAQLLAPWAMHPVPMTVRAVRDGSRDLLMVNNHLEL